MSWIPGFGGGPSVPPPPPPPKDDDPAIKAAQDRLRQAEKRRRGRAETILTGGEGALGAPAVTRPVAGAAVPGARLLGE